MPGRHSRSLPPPALRRQIRSESGQAAVELVVLLPLIVAILALALQALLAGQAVWEARAAARAAARAHAVGADAAAAARAHLRTTARAGPPRPHQRRWRRPRLRPDSHGASGDPPRPRLRQLALPATERMTGQRGQASIEVIGFLPLVLVIALAAFTAVAAHTAGEQAGEAAEAGALMLLQGGGDAREAATEALPKSVRHRARIAISEGRVHVHVRPRLAFPIPGLAEHLAGDASADAGSIP